MGSKIKCIYAACDGEECNSVYYNDCIHYRKHRRNFLLSDIKPLSLTQQNFKNPPSKRSSITFSRNEQQIKAQCATTAIKTNQRVKKLTLSQVITAAIEGLEVEETIIYIDCQVCSMDQVKARQVLTSYADKLTLTGNTVFIYAKVPAVIAEDHWIKL